MNVDTFRQLLPALQHTARFPTCKLDVVCKLYGWDESALRAALGEDPITYTIDPSYRTLVLRAKTETAA